MSQVDASDQVPVQLPQLCVDVGHHHLLDFSKYNQLDVWVVVIHQPQGIKLIVVRVRRFRISLYQVLPLESEEHPVLL
jgi:hypothetical protein